VFTVADLLALPAVVTARPELVCGDRLDRRPVRWVHTSEIYDIAPLLKGGEVLLTTGLGLVAASAEARSAYIASLANVGVAALIMELGRTFPTVPPELVTAARSHALPLVLLHGVVPFIEVTEAAHTRLLGGDVEQLRSNAAVSDQLLQALAANRGALAFTGAIGELAGVPVALVDADGALVAGSAVEGAAMAEPVLLEGKVWGRLEAHRSPDERDPERIAAVLRAAAALMPLELGHHGAESRSRPRAGADLVRDMVNGNYASAAELTSRARGVGLQLRPGLKAVALCLRPRGSLASTARVLIAARAVAPKLLGPALIAEHDGDVLIGAVVSGRDLRPTLARFAAALNVELHSAVGSGVLVSASAAVDAVPELVAAFPAAIDTARLAQRLTPAATVVSAADFALYQLLVSLVDDEALERFVNEQLGLLLEHDARTGAGLVMTLDAYLASALSKTRTAESLGIRRQTLYGRLERIAVLLGGLDLDNRERRTALDLALVSWRLRASGTRPAGRIRSESTARFPHEP
jgi:purine catabolism regulator